MKTLQRLLLFQLFTIWTVGAVQFFPFGLENRDLALDREDDAFTTINIQSDFPFFETNFRQVHISTNGIIFFGQGSTEYVPRSFPLNGTLSVAAYWVDSDPREGGNVFYRETFDPEILENITQQVRKSFINYRNFRSNWALITTFNNVPRYSCGNPVSCSAVVNHQTILTTNGIQSFVIFLYDKLDYAHAQTGFNAGDGKRFFMTIKSNTNESGNYALAHSNVGEAGKWMFSIQDQISGGCNSEGKLSIYPQKVFYAGSEDLEITGPCFENNSTEIKVKFDGEEVSCNQEDVKIKCLTPYVDRLGKVNVTVEANNIIYSGFFLTYDENDPLIDEADMTALEEEENLNIMFDDIEVGSQVRGFKQIFYLDSNYRLKSVDSFPLIETFESSEQFNNRLNELLQKPSRVKRIPLLLIITRINLIYKTAKKLYKMYKKVKKIVKKSADISCKIWNNVDSLIVDIDEIKNTESKRNPCQPNVESFFPSTLTGGFVQDSACRPNTIFSLCSFFHPGAKGCYRSTNNPANVAVQCCYDNNNQLMIGPPGGGTIDLVDSKVSKYDHFVLDVLPYILCCKLSNNCEKYYQRRPSVGSEHFVPPRITRASGDPHFVTLDGFSYEFNPVGEFIYLKTPKTQIQCRMTQYVDEMGVARQGSFFSAFVMKTDQEEKVQVNLSPGKFLIVTIGNTEMNPDTYNFLNMSVSFNDTNFRFSSTDGVVIQLESLGGIMHVITTLSKKLKGSVYGLVGKWDDNMTNDLTLPDYQVIPINSTSSEIYHNFGLKWSTYPSSSLFTYSPGLSWEDFQNSYFQPFFGPVEDNVPECEGNQACLFDYHVTGNLNLSLSNVALNKTVQKTETYFSELEKTCQVNLRVDNGEVDTKIYNHYQITYTLTCDEGFASMGTKTIMCTNGHFDKKIGSCEAISSSSNLKYGKIYFLTFVTFFIFFNLIFKI